MADGADGAVDAKHRRPELRGTVSGQVGKVAVLTRLEQDHDRQPAWLVECGEPPALVCPEIVLVRLPAAPAVDSAFAESRPIVARRLEFLRRYGADEGPLGPFLDRRDAQRAVSPLPELLGRLSHYCFFSAAL